MHPVKLIKRERRLTSVKLLLLGEGYITSLSNYRSLNAKENIFIPGLLNRTGSRLICAIFYSYCSLNVLFQTNMTLAKLDAFLASPFYKHWSSFLKQGVDGRGERVSSFSNQDSSNNCNQIYVIAHYFRFRISLTVMFRSSVKSV